MLASFVNGTLRADIQADPGAEGDTVFFSLDGTVYGQWAGTDAARTALTATRRNVDVAVGDIDGNRFDDDIVLVNVRAGGGQRLTVLRWDASLAARAEINLPSGSSPDSVGVATGDVDGDGRDEVVVLADNPQPGGGNSSSLSIRVYDAPASSADVSKTCLPAASGSLCVTEKLSFIITASTQSADVAVADTDGDGRAEIIVAYATSTQTHVDTLDVVGARLSYHKRFASGANQLDGVGQLSVTAGDLIRQGKAQIIAAFRNDAGLADAIRLEDRASVGAGMIYHAPTENIDGDVPPLVPFPRSGALRPLVSLADYDDDAIALELAVLPSQQANCRVVTENQVKSMVFLPPAWSGFAQARAGWIGSAQAIEESQETSATSFNTHSIHGYAGVGVDAGLVSGSVKVTAAREFTNSRAIATGLVDGQSSSATWSLATDFIVFESTQYACHTYQLKRGTTSLDGNTRMCELRAVNELSANLFAWDTNPDYRSSAGAGLRWIPAVRTWANQALINGAMAVQSSTAAGADAGRAINNVIASSDFSQTNTETNPWWMVDLGVTQLISKVRIVNRDGSSGQALSGASVFVGLQDFRGIANDADAIAANPQVTFSRLRGPQVFDGETLVTWNAQNEPVVGRYVKIMLEGSKSLSLGEVQVFGADQLDPDRHPTAVADANPVDGKFEVMIHDPATGSSRSVDIPGTLVFNGVAADTLQNRTVSAGGADLTYALSSSTGSNTRTAFGSANSASIGVEIDAEAGLFAKVQFGGGTEFTSGVETEEARAISVTESFDIGGTIGGTPDATPQACQYQIRPFYYTTRQRAASGYEHEYLVIDYAVPGGAGGLDRSLDVAACKAELQAPATSALLAHWPFEGNALDISGNMHDGTLQGAATFSAGAIGQALDLTGGNGWVDIATPVMNQLPACSVALWVNVASFTPGDPQQTCCNGVFMEDSFIRNGFHNNLVLGDRPEVAFVFGGLSGKQARTAAPPPNTWAHFVYTYNSANGAFQLYLDGRLDSSGSSTVFTEGEPLPTCGSGLASSIGAWDSSGAGAMTRFLDGRIDDLRLYGRILSAEEAAALAAMGGATSRGDAVFCSGFEAGSTGGCD